MSRARRQLDSVLIKPAGPDCNLACRYCFYLDKDAFFSESKTHRMTPEILEATVRQVMTHAGQNVSFGWQGGEPTLMGVEFFRQAVELERRHGQERTVGNGLQTNGLLIDDQWCRFLADAHFLVGLSLDGPEHVHDRYRLHRDGRPSSSRVTEAARRLLDAGVEVNALTVLNDYSARFPREIYEHHKRLGLHFMQFIPCLEPDPRDPSQPAPFSVSPEQFGRFLCETFDCWLADFEDDRPTTSIRWFDSIFATYVDVTPPECTLSAECGSYLVVEHNGEVFSCDFYVEPEWRLGNVLTDDLAELLNSPRQAAFGRRKADLSHACQTCPWLKHCRGGCPKERWGASSNEKQSRLCDGYRMFFEHADAKLHALADDWIKAQRPAPPPNLPDFGLPDHNLHNRNFPHYEFPDRELPDQDAPPPQRVGRNAPCPCGSGLKYKRCCGRNPR